MQIADRPLNSEKINDKKIPQGFPLSLDIDETMLFPGWKNIPILYKSQ